MSQPTHQKKIKIKIKKIKKIGGKYKLVLVKWILLKKRPVIFLHLLLYYIPKPQILMGK